jgi:Spy/CpxP family protein refolding chaperone
MHHGPGGLGPMGGILRQLDLTDEQRQQVRDRIEHAMDGELGRLMRDHRQKRHELRRLVHDPSSEESAITSAVQAATADAGALALAQHRLAVSVFEVLTPEQREEALELLAQAPQRMQRRMHRGPGEPDPEE